MVRTRKSAAAELEGPLSRFVTVASEEQRSKAMTSSSDSSTVPTPSGHSSGSEYTTPLTSNVGTPASVEDRQRRPAKRLNRIEVHLPAAKASSNRALRSGKFSMNSKRKRDVVDDSEDDGFSDNSPDAKLARRLQDEEDEAAAQILSVSKPTIGLRRSLRGLADPLVTSPASLSKAEHDGTDSAASTLRGSSGKATALGSRSSAGFRRKQIMIVKDSEDEDSGAEQVDKESDSDAEGVDEESDSDASSFRPLSKRRPGAAAASRRPIRLKEPTAVPTPAPGEYPDGFLFLENPGGNSESLDDFDFDSFLAAHSGEESDGFTFPLNIDDDDDDHPGAPGTLDQAIRTATMSRRAYRAYRSGRRLKRDRGRLELHHPELTTMWKDLENMPVLKAGKAEQPNSISRQLKPFQLEGLAWMKAMENTEWKGGLLGDEMGLGKTIQAVSLIMSDFPARKPSLVLVPPVALMQWMTEIDSYTDGRLKTLVFHGTNAKSKNLTVKELKGYNVIIMSYNSLESMYRKQEKGFKRKDGVFKEKSIIHQTEFHRVILDEAHCIKTRTTMTAKACFALKVTYRWCLSGTPLQNRIGEFFSLVRFLNIRPFACYLCKHCPCSTLEWQMDDNNNCTACGHGGMRHVSVFNQELLNPIQKYGNMGPGREAFRKLRILTDRIMLRRLKKDHTDSMELPVKEINVERQFFGEEENDFANSIMTSGQRKFDTYVASGVLLNNYANIFGLIMQMRQVADHPDLILKKNSEGGQNILVCSICDEPAEDAVRSRCKHDFCRTCVKSYLNSSMEPNCPRCHIPLSIDLEQPEIEQDEAMVKKSSIINRIKMENWTSSSKIELLVHELHKLRSDKASHKSIIFSQFTTMLQLIEWRLRRAGITTVMLDGSMTPAQRQASIEHFMKNVDVECFLVSLKAGGVALNLTEASHVFIVDPWWNPAAEWQSADRCHRIGQSRPCTITRLCIEDSVESRMVLLQEKKTNMINSTINSDDAAMDSLSPEDLQFLFRGS